MIAQLISVAGTIVALGALVVFACQRPFMGRVWAFGVMTGAGLTAVGAQVGTQDGGWGAFLLLAAPGVLISAALMLVGLLLTRELHRLSGEKEPDGREGRHD